MQANRILKVYGELCSLLANWKDGGFCYLKRLTLKYILIMHCS